LKGGLLPKLVWLALIIAVAAVLLVRLRRPGGAASVPPDKDAATLEQLVTAGSDLSRPHTPEFFLYLPTEASAQAVAARYTAVGFIADVHHAPKGSDWSCVLKKAMVLTPDTLRQLRREFTEVAAAHGGEYEGWGAEVEK
jgi:hypothetical protein